jgi:diguanylate cyclase (GGDEF)-like protein
MTGDRSPRVARGGRRRTLGLVGPWAWSLWTIPRPFLIYILLIDAAAIAVIALTADMVPVSSRHVGWFSALAVASILHLEFMRGIERLRELHSHGRVFTNLKSVWTFAGLLVLPPSLVAALIVITYTHMWFRVSQQIMLHRWVFSTCNVVLASAAGGAILALAYPSAYPSLPHGLLGFGVVMAAAVARWLVNSTLTAIALLFMHPGSMTPRTAFGPAADNVIEFGSLGLGVLAAVLIVFDPAFLLALAIPVAVVHRGLLLHQFEHAAHRDRTTGLHNSGFWHELACQALERAHQQHTTVGLLLIHLDGYNVINDRHGADACNRVLRHVAEVLRAEVRRDDLVGRLTDEEFVILLPATAEADLTNLVDRLRRTIRELTVEVDGPDGPITIRGLTLSIGGAVYPHNAVTLPELMLVADNAIFAAKTYVRDQARFVRPGTQVPATRQTPRP